MKKFQLHQRGLNELQQALYALPDYKLAMEVMALRIDLNQWIKSKFELTQDELANLNQLNAHFIEYAAIKSSDFLALRKPFRFAIIEFKPE